MAIYPFPNRNTSNNGGLYAFKTRLIAALSYLALAILLYRMGSNGLTLLMLLGLLYWAFIHQRKIQTSWFTRFHVLQSLILFFFTSILITLLQVLFAFLGAFSNLVGLLAFVGSILSEINLLITLGGGYLLLILGIFSAIMALMGRAHHIPLVTNNVRAWI